MLTARHDDMQASYTVGRLSVSAFDIECTVLKMNPATYRPQIVCIITPFMCSYQPLAIEFIIMQQQQLLYPKQTGTVTCNIYQYLEVLASIEGSPKRKSIFSHAPCPISLFGCLFSFLYRILLRQYFMTYITSN